MVSDEVTPSTREPMNQLIEKTAPRTSDRRAAARYQPAFGTTCRLGSVTARRAVGLVWDLSTSGVSILMADPPEGGTILPAELAFEGASTTLSISLQVVHVRSVSTGDYFVGARFTRPLSPAEMAPFVTPALGTPLPAGKAS